MEEKTAAKDNGQSVNLTAKGSVTFTVAGGSFAADVLDLIYVFNDLAAEVKAAEKSQREYLLVVIDYIEKKYCVSMTMGEADTLNDEIERLHLAKKKAHADAIASMQT